MLSLCEINQWWWWWWWLVCCQSNTVNCKPNDRTLIIKICQQLLRCTNRVAGVPAYTADVATFRQRALIWPQVAEVRSNIGNNQFHLAAIFGFLLISSFHFWRRLSIYKKHNQVLNVFQSVHTTALVTGVSMQSMRGHQLRTIQTTTENRINWSRRIMTVRLPAL